MKSSTIPVASIFTLVLILGIINQASCGLARLTRLNGWLNAACLVENLKQSDRYICDAFGRIRCMPGYTNEANLCEDPVCNPACVEGQGNCTKPNGCTCEVGWMGRDCSKCVCLPGCKNGACSSPFQCNCFPGWKGMLCDQPICLPGCINGECFAPGECNCAPGWSGPMCNECSKLPGCSEQGYCNKPLECICRDGYEGYFCERPKCRAGCNKQKGFCTKPGECWCKPGWTGPRCEDCMTYPGCKNGHCINPWDCICNNGFTGMLCDETGQNGTNATFLPQSSYYDPIANRLPGSFEEIQGLGSTQNKSTITQSFESLNDETVARKVRPFPAAFEEPVPTYDTIDYDYLPNGVEVRGLGPQDFQAQEDKDKNNASPSGRSLAGGVKSKLGLTNKLSEPGQFDAEHKKMTGSGFGFDSASENVNKFDEKNSDYVWSILGKEKRIKNEDEYKSPDGVNYHPDSGKSIKEEEDEAKRPSSPPNEIRELKPKVFSPKTVDQQSRMIQTRSSAELDDTSLHIASDRPNNRRFQEEDGHQARRKNPWDIRNQDTVRSTTETPVLPFLADPPRLKGEDLNPTIGKQSTEDETLDLPESKEARKLELPTNNQSKPIQGDLIFTTNETDIPSQRQEPISKSDTINLNDTTVEPRNLNGAEDQSNIKKEVSKVSEATIIAMINDLTSLDTSKERIQGRNFQPTSVSFVTEISASSLSFYGRPSGEDLITSQDSVINDGSTIGSENPLVITRKTLSSPDFQSQNRDSPQLISVSVLDTLQPELTMTETSKVTSSSLPQNLNGQEISTDETTSKILIGDNLLNKQESSLKPGQQDTTLPSVSVEQAKLEVSKNTPEQINNHLEISISLNGSVPGDLIKNTTNYEIWTTQKNLGLDDFQEQRETAEEMPNTSPSINSRNLIFANQQEPTHGTITETQAENVVLLDSIQSENGLKTLENDVGQSQFSSEHIETTIHSEVTGTSEASTLIPSLETLLEEIRRRSLNKKSEPVLLNRRIGTIDPVDIHVETTVGPKDNFDELGHTWTMLIGSEESTVNPSHLNFQQMSEDQQKDSGASRTSSSDFELGIHGDSITEKPSASEDFVQTTKFNGKGLFKDEESATIPMSGIETIEIGKDSSNRPEQETGLSTVKIVESQINGRADLSQGKTTKTEESTGSYDSIAIKYAEQQLDSFTNPTKILQDAEISPDSTEGSDLHDIFSTTQAVIRDLEPALGAFKEDEKVEVVNDERKFSTESVIRNYNSTESNQKSLNNENDDILREDTELTLPTFNKLGIHDQKNFETTQSIEIQTQKAPENISDPTSNLQNKFHVEFTTHLKIQATSEQLTKEKVVTTDNPEAGSKVQNNPNLHKNTNGTDTFFTSLPKNALYETTTSNRNLDLQTDTFNHDTTFFTLDLFQETSTISTYNTTDSSPSGMERTNNTAFEVDLASNKLTVETSEGLYPGELTNGSETGLFNSTENSEIPKLSKNSFEDSTKPIEQVLVSDNERRRMERFGKKKNFVHASISGSSSLTSTSALLSSERPEIISTVFEDGQTTNENYFEDSASSVDDDVFEDSTKGFDLGRSLILEQVKKSHLVTVPTTSTASNSDQTTKAENTLNLTTPSSAGSTQTFNRNVEDFTNAMTSEKRSGITQTSKDSFKDSANGLDLNPVTESTASLLKSRQAASGITKNEIKFSFTPSSIGTPPVVSGSTTQPPLARESTSSISSGNTGSILKGSTESSGIARETGNNFEGFTNRPSLETSLITESLRKLNTETESTISISKSNQSTSETLDKNNAINSSPSSNNSVPGVPGFTTLTSNFNSTDKITRTPESNFEDTTRENQGLNPGHERQSNPTINLTKSIFNGYQEATTLGSEITRTFGIDLLIGAWTEEDGRKLGNEDDYTSSTLTSISSTSLYGNSNSSETAEISLIPSFVKLLTQNSTDPENLNNFEGSTLNVKLGLTPESENMEVQETFKKIIELNNTQIVANYTPGLRNISGNFTLAILEDSTTPSTQSERSNVRSTTERRYTPETTSLTPGFRTSPEITSSLIVNLYKDSALKSIGVLKDDQTTNKGHEEVTEKIDTAPLESDQLFPPPTSDQKESSTIKSVFSSSNNTKNVDSWTETSFEISFATEKNLNDVKPNKNVSSLSQLAAFDEKKNENVTGRSLIQASETETIDNDYAFFEKTTSTSLKRDKKLTTAEINNISNQNPEEKLIGLHENPINSISQGNANNGSYTSRNHLVISKQDDTPKPTLVTTLFDTTVFPLVTNEQQPKHFKNIHPINHTTLNLTNSNDPDTLLSPGQSYKNNLNTDNQTDDFETQAQDDDLSNVNPRILPSPKETLDGIQCANTTNVNENYTDYIVHINSSSYTDITIRQVSNHPVNSSILLKRIRNLIATHSKTFFVRDSNLKSGDFSDNLINSTDQEGFEITFLGGSEENKGALSAENKLDLKDFNQPSEMVEGMSTNNLHQKEATIRTGPTEEEAEALLWGSYH